MKCGEFLKILHNKKSVNMVLLSQVYMQFSHTKGEYKTSFDATEKIRHFFILNFIAHQLNIYMEHKEFCMQHHKFDEAHYCDEMKLCVGFGPQTIVC